MTILERTEQIFLKGRVQPVNQHKYDEAFAQAVEERFQAERESTQSATVDLLERIIVITKRIEALENPPISIVSHWPVTGPTVTIKAEEIEEMHKDGRLSYTEAHSFPPDATPEQVAEWRKSGLVTIPADE